MKLNEYQQLALRTAKPAPTKEYGYIHGALGVGSEIGELAECLLLAMSKPSVDKVYVTKELGYYMWFLAYECHEQGINLEDVGVLHEEQATFEYYKEEPITWDAGALLSFLALVAATGSMLTQVKAFYVYGKPFGRDKMMESAALQLKHINKICSLLYISFDAVLVTNIEKLRKSFPDAYSDAAAIARADEKE